MQEEETGTCHTEKQLKEGGKWVGENWREEYLKACGIPSDVRVRTAGYEGMQMLYVDNFVKLYLTTLKN